ncbi:MAG: 23S rRNA (pseudouridine(1915)-N(3))-methyltransferase RlmH [Alphaproteobacteria bacterium]|nr:23S rRNA (pseudouridine(1915)-N(3))-methyltransferase RlmH [Alphaproteobacteria bacterium]
MRIAIVAIGRLKGGPEAALTEDYLTRARAGGRSLGLTGFEAIEREAKPPSDSRKEAGLILAATAPAARTVLLDERGAEWSSRQLAEKLAAWRDGGTPELCFWIGGADGAAQTLKDQADEKLAFGRQTWPHRLVRVLLAEQLYRAVTILGHAPYHRD